MKFPTFSGLILTLAGIAPAVAGPPAGQVDRYVVPEVTAQLGGTVISRIISLLQVTVRNNGSQACNVSLRFEHDGAITYCTLGVAALQPGRAYTFCTSNVDFMGASCDSPTCADQTGGSLYAGRGVIASTTGTACGNLALEAQRFYLFQPHTGSIEFRTVTPARFVKAGGASIGD